jgi:hypothetical protein
LGRQAPPPGIAEQPTVILSKRTPQSTLPLDQQVPVRPAGPAFRPEPEPEPFEPPAYRPPDEPSPRAYRQPEESPLQYQRERDRRADRGVLIANTVRVVTALIALAFVLHIVFSLFGANQNSGFVGFDYDVSKVFVLGFGDVFTPGDATIGLIANYGLAAIVYLVVGRIVYRTLRRT